MSGYIHNECYRLRLRFFGFWLIVTRMLEKAAVVTCGAAENIGREIS
jgi:hypothetical protein